MPIGFFTHGVEYTLPHPRISERIILLICMAIKKAWQLLEEKPPSGFYMQSSDEDTITQLLVEVIENRLRKGGEIDGFNYISPLAVDIIASTSRCWRRVRRCQCGVAPIGARPG
jgi:hypothetical protein